MATTTTTLLSQQSATKALRQFQSEDALHLEKELDSVTNKIKKFKRQNQVYRQEDEFHQDQLSKPLLTEGADATSTLKALYKE